jgi:uncharacterized membrane protein YphA (DoxX/SURF4 family)
MQGIFFLVYFGKYIFNMNLSLLFSLPSPLFEGATILQLLFSAMVSILFIQSGLDKVRNWKGEKAYYEKHFSKTFLKSSVSLLLPVITFFELAAGFLSAVGIILIVILHNKDVALWGMGIGALTIVQLFFGQRVAKDYEGAAALVPYFLLCGAGLYMYLFW